MITVVHSQSFSLVPSLRGNEDNNNCADHEARSNLDFLLITIPICAHDLDRLVPRPTRPGDEAAAEDNPS